MKMDDARIHQRRIYLALPLDIKMAGQKYTIYVLELMKTKKTNPMMNPHLRELIRLQSLEYYSANL